MFYEVECRKDGYLSTFPFRATLVDLVMELRIRGESFYAYLPFRA